MKIAFLTNIKSPYKSLQIKKFSEINNVNFSVYYTEPSNKKIKWEEKNLNLNEFDLNEVKWLRKYSIILNTGLRNIVKNNDLILISGYDQMSMILVSILCKINKKPYVIFFDGISTNRLLSKENFLKKLIKTFVIRNSFAAMANGEIGKRYLNEKFNYDINKIYNQFLSIDYNAILDLKKENIIHRTFLREKYKIDEKETVILYSGRLIEKKNILSLVKAIGKLKEYKIKFVITGGGELEEEICLACEKENINFLITGFINNQKELFKHYFMADMLVLPSVDEPWGLVVNEAMVAGLPVVVSNICGCSLDLVVEEENGYTVDPLDISDIKNKIELVIKNNNNNLMGEKSTKIIEKWNFDNSKLNLEKIVERVKNG